MGAWYNGYKMQLLVPLARICNPCVEQRKMDVVAHGLQTRASEYAKIFTARADLQSVRGTAEQRKTDVVAHGLQTRASEGD
jgi:hypothetical protein